MLRSALRGRELKSFVANSLRGFAVSFRMSHIATHRWQLNRRHVLRGLGATLAEVQLVLVVYAATYGVCLLNGARLGDLFGRRRLFLIGMALFTIASGLCGEIGRAHV